MKQIFKYFFLWLLSFSLLISNAQAGNYMAKGSVLKEDSYVFNIIEATDLMEKMSELEKETNQQKALIEQYKLLDQNTKDQNFNLNDLLKTKELQLQEYEKLHTLDQNRIQQLDKQANHSKIENWLFLGAGVAITVGAILVADKIDDQIQTNNAPQNGIISFQF